MSNGIGNIGGNSSMMQSIRGVKPPASAQMAEKLFSKLDTSGQGYLQKSDLQAAFDRISPSSSSAASKSGTSNVDELFLKLDSNGNGSVTKQEFSETLIKLTEQLDEHFMRMSMSMSGGAADHGGGGMLPPPRDGAGDSGFTKDELSSQLKEVGTSDKHRFDLNSRIVSNFDAADSDGNGKVSRDEAQAYDRASESSSTPDSSAFSVSSSSSDDVNSGSAANELNAKIMMQIMQLMHAYVPAPKTDGPASTLSVSA